MSNLAAAKKIVVTGGAGFLGAWVVRELEEQGVDKSTILIPRSHEYDLRTMEACATVVADADIIIHMAAAVGGIGYNREHPATLYYDNIMMGTQLMEAARQANVGTYISVGSVCAYPKHTSVPFSEDAIWDGYPEETNAPYGIAKKAQIVQGQAYHEQYGFTAVHVIPVNLYGPGDNFDPASSHVIPALIRKVAEAKKQGTSSITVWGTGTATREFLYVADAAKGIVAATRTYREPEPVNLGTGYEISIRHLTELICELMGYDGGIVWDDTKPDGQPRRCLDTQRARDRFGFTAETTLREGLRATIDWYIENDHSCA